MTIYSLYIFNRKWFCVHYQAFNRSKSSNLTFTQEFKLVFGLLHSLRGISKKLGTSFANSDNFNAYSTNTYKLTYFESPTGIKFILLTDKHENTENTKKCLQNLYASTFYNFVVRTSTWLEISQIEGDEDTDLYKIKNSHCRSYFMDKAVAEIETYFKSLNFY